jgi:L-alanine-DL-glutamate epimerase-like enolase superfamily enzyme
LREGLAMPFPEISDGFSHVPNAPGLGVEPEFEMVKKYIVSNKEIKF